MTKATDQNRPPLTCRHRHRTPTIGSCWRCDNCGITGVYAWQLDAAINHLDSVAAVCRAKRTGEKVVPFPPRQAGRVPA